MTPELRSPQIAYFSMEIAFDPTVPTYSGGLGVLAGDTLRSAADWGLPMVAVTLVHRKGYFRQTLGPRGEQQEQPDRWRPEDLLEPVDPQVEIRIEGRRVRVRAWKYTVKGLCGHRVPILLLDTDLDGNSDYDRSLADSLYGGDERYRLCQEAVLGLGGVRMVEAAGCDGIRSYHMNEGHSALLALGLLRRELAEGRNQLEEAMDRVRERCVFTTHTPVPAGHDQFSGELMRSVLGDEDAQLLDQTDCCHEGGLNMTYLALRCSHYVNGVAMHHGAISRGMFPNYPVRAITNGVHALTWTCGPMQRLFDRYIPEWRHDNRYLRYAIGISAAEVWSAHAEAKRDLLAEVTAATGARLDETVMTIGFARRAASYKRADLLFYSLDRLSWIARHVGPMQVLLAGKAHPRDEGGKDIIRKVHDAARELGDTVRVVYVPNYDMGWGKRLASGVDLWLNTPKRPQEASGTSGMKAALNAVPSLSILDGWWIEGHLEGITGWSIGDHDGPDGDAAEVATLYDKLERVILPLYYAEPMKYALVGRSAIALNGSFFNTQRMVSQYAARAYFPEKAV